MHRLFLIGAALAAVLLIGVQVTVAQDPTATTEMAETVESPIPENIRQSLLAGGVNLQFGFYDTDNYEPESFDEELPLIAEAGARHVRLPISMDILERDQTGRLRSDRFADVKRFVELAQSYGLLTIIDVHNTGLRECDGCPWTENYMWGVDVPSVRERHTSLMVALVTELYRSGLDRDWFVVQPANEPIFSSNPGDWYAYQAELLGEMRQECPDCVFFAMAHDWQSIQATVDNLNPPLDDPLLIYDVHFYEPLALTHCAFPGQENTCLGLEYPGTFTSWRGEEYWDKAKIEETFQPLVNWRDQYGVMVHFSEVGTADLLAEDVRAHYLGDVVSTLREDGFGYSIFEWHRNFGVKGFPDVLAAVFPN
ncbi:MAG: cellulase family glycosylhydrolase [Anaerolineae bacterium]|nr:cellulase family glycosylhydrolase [Anaerolineae bacterium]